MKFFRYLTIMIILVLGVVDSSLASNQLTQRIPAFNNSKVNVWKTIVYPSSQTKLKMHRHDYDRVVVALTDGVFKITNNFGKIHYFRLKKGESYFLKKDPINELHTDENLSSHAISVVVIELI